MTETELNKVNEAIIHELYDAIMRRDEKIEELENHLRYFEWQVERNEILIQELGRNEIQP